MAFDPVSIGMTLLGGLLGGQSSSSNQSSSREPWAPAQPWLRNNITQGQRLQDYYQQNPFNAQQQAGYNNLFGDIDYFRNRVAPGMLDFANSMMSSNYQRARGPVGSVGYGNADVVRMDDQPSQVTRSAGPFSMPSSNFGAVDFNASNPFRNGGVTPPSVNHDNPNRIPVTYDGSRGNDSIGSNSTPDWGTTVALGQALSGLGLNTLGDYLQSEGRMGINAQTGAYSQDAQNQRAAEAAAMTDAAATAANAAQAQAEASDRDNGDLSTGGPVTPQHLHGPDPQGPDDGYTALQKGEYVIKKSAVNQYGRGLLDAINQGKLPAKTLRGLL